MRSRLVTLLMVILAGAGAALAVAHFTNQDLSGLFGKPPRPDGEGLLPLDPESVQAVTVDSAGRPRRYEKKLGQWVLATADPPDRANFRALTVLSQFPATLVVMTSFKADEKARAEHGLNPPLARLHYQDGNGREAGELLIGKPSAWHKFIPDPDPKPGQPPNNQNWPALHVSLADDPGRVYICASPLVPEVFANGFGSHRDQHPFFFPPQMLARVTISRPTGSLVLERPSADANWSITSPLQVDTDPEAVARMVEGLFQLAAVKVEDKPAPPAPEPAMSITLNYFSLDGSIHENSTTLAIDRALAADAKTVTARLDDWRKNILFTLPVAGIEGRTGLTDIPLTLDRLRGASLTSLDLELLQSMDFEGPELDGTMTVFIERSPISKEWRARKTYQGKTAGANEKVFFDVKKALAEDEILGVVSDSPGDFANFGLSTPDLKLTLNTFDGNSETLTFGSTVDEDGLPHYFLNRQDSNSIVEVRPETFHNLAHHSYQWRPAMIWNFNLIDLNALEIERPGQEKLTMRYNDLTQTWSVVRLGANDVTPRLVEHRANRLLENLRDLSVVRWLGPDNPAAKSALDDPLFTINAIFREPDINQSTLWQDTLRLAPVVRNSSNRFYYGQLEGDRDTFLIDLAQVKKLAVPLLDE